MSGDEKKRHKSPRSQRRGAPPDDAAASEPADGPYAPAPTRAFQTLPTEVLNVGSHSGRPSSEARTRATRLPPASGGAGLPAPPGTEALGNADVARIQANRQQQFPDIETDHIEMTNPDPFRVDVDSVERALFEVAREPTHHDLYVDDLEGPPSDTSTDAERGPRPVSGVASALHIEFEDPTVALDVEERGLERRSPLFEPTDEDTAVPATAPPAANEPPPAPSEQPGGDRYYEEMREVIAVARVFDPKKAPELVTDPGYRDHSDEWPEITLDRAPRPAVAPSASRSPAMLALFLAAVLIVTVSGVGIGFALQRRGVSLEELWERGSSALAAASAEPAPSAQDAPPSAEAPEAPEEAASAAPGGVIDPSGQWKNRVVSLTFRGFEDVSRSGVKGLDETLMKAFASAVASDEHARWRVVSTPVKRGYGFELDLQIVSVTYDDDKSARVRCVVNGTRRHEPRGEVRGDVSAVRRAEGSLAKAGSEKLAREAARACGFSLALRFFEEGLR